MLNNPQIKIRIKFLLKKEKIKFYKENKFDKSLKKRVFPFREHPVYTCTCSSSRVGLSLILRSSIFLESTQETDDEGWKRRVALLHRKRVKEGSACFGFRETDFARPNDLH